jgi:hypothetical protein
VGRRPGLEAEAEAWAPAEGEAAGAGLVACTGAAVVVVALCVAPAEARGIRASASAVTEGCEGRTEDPAVRGAEKGIKVSGETGPPSRLQITISA